MIANGLAEEEEEEELPTPDVALLPHLKYGEDLIYFGVFSHLSVMNIPCYNSDKIQMHLKKMRAKLHQRRQKQNCGLV